MANSQLLCKDYDFIACNHSKMSATLRNKIKLCFCVLKCRFYLLNKNSFLNKDNL
jgi:hypothetical protein